MQEIREERKEILKHCYNNMRRSREREREREKLSLKKW